MVTEAIDLIIECKTKSSEGIESKTVEFKHYRDQRRLCEATGDIAKEVSAMANTEGGIIIIGVKDSSNVDHGKWDDQLCGISDLDLDGFEERFLPRFSERPPIKMEVIRVEGKKYGVIYVDKANDHVVMTSAGSSFERVGRSSSPMSSKSVVKRVKELQNYDWSDEEVPSACSLDAGAVSEGLADYVERKKAEMSRDGGGEIEDLSEENFLEAVGATKNGHLSKAGLLMFGRSADIKKYLGVFEFRFSWKTRRGALMVNDVWSDNLWWTINRARKHFISCNSKIEVSFRGKKYKAPLFDEVAFHEAYLNALVHRDYGEEGMVIVDYDSSKMKIVNPGQFYGGVTSENIRSHDPRHRNKVLANLLMHFQLVDRAGMGVKRMGRMSLMYGRKFPEFTQMESSVSVTMEGEYLRAGVFIVCHTDTDGLTECQIFIINLLYEKGYLPVCEIMQKVKDAFACNWHGLCDAVKNMKYVQFCGTKNNVYIRVVPEWNTIFDITQNIRINVASDKYVDVYKLAAECGEFMNETAKAKLGHAHSSQTSSFLKRCEFLVNSGSGVNSRWSLRKML